MENMERKSRFITWACVGLLFGGSTSLLNSYQWQHAWHSQSNGPVSTERQLATFMEAAAPGGPLEAHEKNVGRPSYDWRLDGGMEARQYPQWRDCRRLIDSLGIARLESLGRLPARSIDAISATAPCGFQAIDAKPFRLDWPEAIPPLVMASLTGLVLALVALAVLQYEHLGWRRIGISAGVAMALGITIVAGEELSMIQLLALMTISGVVCAGSVLGTRSLVRWIAAGFTS